MELLQKYVLIPLDIFVKCRHNKDIRETYRGTINILRSLNMSDQEIVSRLCAQYRIEEAEIQKYL